MGILDQIKDAVENIQQNFKRFDPSTLNDEVAMKTEWTPAKHGGSRRQIYEFKYDNSYKLEIKVKPHSFLFPIIFIFGGFVPMIMGVFLYFKFLELQMALFTIPFGFSFFAIGLFIFLSYKKSHFFDKTNGVLLERKARWLRISKT